MTLSLTEFDLYVLFCCIDLFLGLWGLSEIPVHVCITFVMLYTVYFTGFST
ncbi:hypothetical protein Sjap_010566 [Stephania japonica]|uniref:Uncharacterized protein n=1 Tax=Stephania japonica TaxID=461633 RepID=A0AAP0J9M5_9MAGN